MSTTTCRSISQHNHGDITTVSSPSNHRTCNVFDKSISVDSHLPRTIRSLFTATHPPPVRPRGPPLARRPSRSSPRPPASPRPHSPAAPPSATTTAAQSLRARPFPPPPPASAPLPSPCPLSSYSVHSPRCLRNPSAPCPPPPHPFAQPVPPARHRNLSRAGQRGISPVPISPPSPRPPLPRAPRPPRAPARSAPRSPAPRPSPHGPGRRRTPAKKTGLSYLSPARPLWGRAGER